MKSFVAVSLSTLAVALASPTYAAEAVAVEPSSSSVENVITVVGIGLPERVDASGQAITVISEAAIDAIQSNDMIRVFERLPGIVISRNGGPGGATGVRVRGAASEQLLVLLDGVRTDDPTLPSGGTSFGNLLAGNVEKVELLRGSNSVIWGSQAIGGVMALTTRQLEGARLSAEYGSFDSFTGTAAAGGTAGIVSGTVAAGYTRTDGYSEVTNDPETDGYRQWEVTGKAKVDPGERLSLVTNGRFADSRREIDGFGGTSTDVQFTRDFSVGAGMRYVGEGPVEGSANFAVYDTRRHYEGPTMGGLAYEARTYRADIIGRWSIVENVSLIFGGAYDWNRFNDGMGEKSFGQTAGHALLQYNDDRVNLAAGARYDQHDTFGGQWTFGANGSFAVTSDIRLRASFGEGFKSPTLYQLFAPQESYTNVKTGEVFWSSGNTGLKPEHSRTYEGGVEFGSRADRVFLGLSVFRRDSQDLIDYTTCASISVGICSSRAGDFYYSTYGNVGRARAEGGEVELSLRPVSSLLLQGVYSYVKAWDRSEDSDGRDLPRRPRHTATLAVDWETPAKGFVIGADLRYVSSSYDRNYYTDRLAAYTLVTLRASLPLTESVELFGRIENMFDEEYQTAKGFSTAGRAAYVGARARF